MANPNLRIHITHIGTATALIELDGLTILTDPYFSRNGTVWTGASGAKLTNTYEPAMRLENLPPIDLIMLSHEDHKDNLDDLGDFGYYSTYVHLHISFVPGFIDFLSLVMRIFMHLTCSL